MVLYFAVIFYLTSFYLDNGKCYSTIRVKSPRIHISIYEGVHPGAALIVRYPQITKHCLQ